MEAVGEGMTIEELFSVYVTFKSVSDNCIVQQSEDGKKGKETKKTERKREKSKLTPKRLRSIERGNARAKFSHPKNHFLNKA
jgi:hypothetical protein